MTDASQPALVHARVLQQGDSVALLLCAAQAGEALLVDGDGAGAGAARTVTTTQAIPIFHKVALCALATGAAVRRSGVVIGVASAPIARGDWVHIHNLVSRRARPDSSPNPERN